MKIRKEKWIPTGPHHSLHSFCFYRLGPRSLLTVSSVGSSSAPVSRVGRWDEHVGREVVEGSDYMTSPTSPTVPCLPLRFDPFQWWGGTTSDGTGGRRFTSLTGRRGHRGSYEMEAGVKRPFHPHGGSGERNEARGLESFILVTVGWVCMVPSVLLEVITSSSDSFSHRCHRITFIFPSFPHYICWSTRFTS